MGRMLFLTPNQQCQSTEGVTIKLLIVAVMSVACKSFVYWIDWVESECVSLCMCVQHDTTRKFFMTVEAPSTIRRGEQIGLRLCIFSTWDQDMEVLCFLLPTTFCFHFNDYDTNTHHLSAFQWRIL